MEVNIVEELISEEAEAENAEKADSVEGSEALSQTETPETAEPEVVAISTTGAGIESGTTIEESVEEMIKVACPQCKEPVEILKAFFLAGQRPECSNPDCVSNRGKKKQRPAAKSVSIEIEAVEPQVEKLEEENGVVEAGIGEHRTFERRGRRGLSKAIAEYFESKGLNPDSRKHTGNSAIPAIWNVNDIPDSIRSLLGNKFSPTLEELLTSKLYFDMYPTMPRHLRADWIKAGLPIFCFDDPSEQIEDPQLQQLWIRTGHVRCAKHSEIWNHQVQVEAKDGTQRTLSHKWARFHELTGKVPELGDEAIAQRRQGRQEREARNAANTTRDPLDGIIGSSTASSEACACESAAKHQVQNCYEGEKCQVEGCDELSVRSQSGSKRDSKLCITHRDEREKAMAEQKAEQKAAHEAKKARKAADDRYATKEDVAEAIEISNEAILDRLDKIQSDTISLVHAYTAQPEQIVNATTTQDVWAQLDADLQAISEITGRRVN